MMVRGPRLGRLCQNGLRRVRIAKITRAWVASDSTNQSKIELIGPKTSMKRSIPPMSQFAGSATVSGSTLSDGARVDEVVEEDLTRHEPSLRPSLDGV
jgi:hypothetical protein